MKPTKEEIEKALGGEIPEGVNLEYGETIPADKDDLRFDLVVAVKDKFNVFKKSRAGKLVGFYVALCGLGFPIPAPYDICTTVISHSHNLVEIAYNHLIDEIQEDPEYMVVKLPEGLELSTTEDELDFDGVPLSLIHI